MEVSLNDIKIYYTQIPNINQIYLEYEKYLNKVENKIDLLLILLNNLITDNSIISKLNSYYCSKKPIKRDFCYQYLNNIINPLNSILVWKSKRDYYKSVITNIHKNIIFEKKPEEIEIGLAANYIKNFNNANKIIGKEILIDFAYKNEIVDNPGEYLIKGTIKYYNNIGNYIFFLLNNFTIEFDPKNISDKQLNIIETFSNNNRFICWKYTSNNKYKYNLVLWNGINNGLKFKFIKKIGSMELKRDFLIKNIKDDMIYDKISNSQLAYYYYTIKQIICSSHLFNKPFNFKNISPISNFLSSYIKNTDVFSYTFKDSSLKIFVHLEIYKENDFKFNDISQHNIYYNLKEIKASKDWFKLNNIQFNNLINNFYYKYPWSWLIMTKPKLIGIKYDNIYYSYKDLTKLTNNKKIELFNFSYFSWQINEIDKYKNLLVNNNKDFSQNYIYTIINLLLKKNANEFKEVLNETTYKEDIVSNFNFYSKKWFKCTNIKTCSNTSLYSVTQDILIDPLYNNYLINSEISGIIIIINNLKNYNTKILTYILLIKYIEKHFKLLISDLSESLDTWKNIQFLLNSQVHFKNGNNIDNNIDKDKNINKKQDNSTLVPFNEKLQQIKYLLNKVQCQ